MQVRICEGSEVQFLGQVESSLYHARRLEAKHQKL